MMLPTQRKPDDQDGCAVPHCKRPATNLTRYCRKHLEQRQRARKDRQLWIGSEQGPSPPGKVWTHTGDRRGQPRTPAMGRGHALHLAPRPRGARATGPTPRATWPADALWGKRGPGDNRSGTRPGVGQGVAAPQEENATTSWQPRGARRPNERDRRQQPFRILRNLDPRNPRKVRLPRCCTVGAPRQLRVWAYSCEKPKVRAANARARSSQ
jgi:hypothetical protein